MKTTLLCLNCKTWNIVKTHFFSLVVSLRSFFRITWSNENFRVKRTHGFLKEWILRITFWIMHAAGNYETAHMSVEGIFKENNEIFTRLELY